MSMGVLVLPHVLDGSSPTLFVPLGGLLLIMTADLCGVLYDDCLYRDVTYRSIGYNSNWVGPLLSPLTIAPIFLPPRLTDKLGLLFWLTFAYLGAWFGRVLALQQSFEAYCWSSVLVHLLPQCTRQSL